MPLYLYTEGLTLAVYQTALHCYAWVVFEAGSPNRILEWGETVGRHGLEQAISEAREEMRYQAYLSELEYNEDTPLQARRAVQPPFTH